MKHLDAIRKDAERLAARLDLKLETIAGYSDGSYRVELKERDAEPRKIGFDTNEPGARGPGSNTAGSARERSEPRSGERG